MSKQLPSDPNDPYWSSAEYRLMQRNYQEGWQRTGSMQSGAHRPVVKQSAEDEYYTSGDWLAER